jgi:S1-C subfamily serine protease
MNYVTRFCLAVLGVLCAIWNGRAAAQENDGGYHNWQAQENIFANRLGAMNGRDAAAIRDLAEQLKAETTVELKLPDHPKAMPKEPAGIYRDARSAVVAVGHAYKCKNCPNWHASCASGFVLTPDGVVVTNYHVVEEQDENRVLGVRTFDGTVYPVLKVRASSQEHDVALVRIEADSLPVLPLGGDVEVGEDVYVLSHPVGALYTFTEGMVSNKFRRDRKGSSHNEFSITADFAKGSSGGPILNRKGEVVGIVRATDSTYYERNNQNLQMVWKFCVPSEYILRLVKPRQESP